MFDIGELIIRVRQTVEGLSGGNTMIAGAISLWLLGMCTYVFRSAPINMWRFFLKHTTTTMVLTNYNQVFFDLMAWMEEKGVSDRARRVKITNGRYGWEDKFTKGLGYGSHILWFNHTPFKINLSTEASNSDRDKETLSMICLGRSHKPIDRLLKTLREKRQADKDSTDMYRYTYKDGWIYVDKQPSRPMSSVIMDEAVRDKLLRTFSEFEEKEEWYVKQGIPYQLGVLLHGPPGTGKTSLIRAMAGHLKKHLYIAQAGQLRDMESMLAGCKKNSIIVIEDVDSHPATKARVPVPKREKAVTPSIGEGAVLSRKLLPDTPQPAAVDPFDAMDMLSLSEILNAMDGAFVKHGRVLFMTTNHLDKLDPAMLRPGRIDLLLEIGYLSEDMFDKFLVNFFDEGLGDGHKLLPDVDLTGAVLQGDILQGATRDDLLSKYCAVSNG